MKIAIFHNYLDNIGGAEIVGLTLAREFNADVYTTNIDKEKINKMGFSDVIPRIFSIGTVPINAPFKQQFSLWKFRKLNLFVFPIFFTYTIHNFVINRINLPVMGININLQILPPHLSPPSNLLHLVWPPIV